LYLFPDVSLDLGRVLDGLRSEDAHQIGHLDLRLVRRQHSEPEKMAAVVDKKLKPFFGKPLAQLKPFLVNLWRRGAVVMHPPT
jgi:hypothetical protein